GMVMQRACSYRALTYLADLRHTCGACYTACQFSQPHEFNVNVPQTFAILRAESWSAYAWPRAFSGMFARNGVAISIVAALSVAGFIFRFAALNDPQALFVIHSAPCSVYAFLPYNASLV